MSNPRQSTPAFQRNALAPGLLAAIALLASMMFPSETVATVVLFIVAILALVVASFAWQAKQWWWSVVFVAIAVLWNPVWPFDFSGTWWVAAQPIAAGVFIVAGLLIKNGRAPEAVPRRAS